jgi:TetR/AcrR family transcriptional repressor of nem operon
MRYDTEHKQRTREKVLKAATKEIRAHGPHRLGVAAVMSGAGLTHGGFYAHFSSKDDLIGAAINEMFNEGRARFELETEGYPTAEGLSRYIDFYLSSKHRDATTLGCPIPVLAADARRLSESAREHFARGVEGLASRLAEQLKSLGRRDAQAEAHSVLNELVGALSVARCEPNIAKSDAVLNASKAAIKQRLGLESAR